jgi:(hydroxyamino)benzene mutase
VTTSPTALRHPLDPEPVRSTKAGTVFALGLVALVTGPFVGGLVPASIAIALAGQARREAFRSEGYLTGSAWLRRGEKLAWVGVALAATSLVVAVVIGVVDFAGDPAGHDFAPGVD